MNPITWVLKKFFGSKNARMVKTLRPVVARINELEQEYRSLSDDALREKVAKWKEELKPLAWSAQKEYLDRILPEAFAAVKNAAFRLNERKAQFTVCEQPMTWAMVHFDTQLIGGYCLHKGMIAEMATGEGKTLVATLPLFLNGTRAAGRTSSPRTTTSPAAMRSGWGSSIFFSASPSASSSTISRPIYAANSTRRTSATA